MPSLTIRVWIGTHVSRSKPNQVVPLSSPRVWEDDLLLSNPWNKIFHQKLTLTLRTERADSILIPHLPSKSV